MSNVTFPYLCGWKLATISLSLDYCHLKTFSFWAKKVIRVKAADLVFKCQKDAVQYSEFVITSSFTCVSHTLISWLHHANWCPLTRVRNTTVPCSGYVASSHRPHILHLYHVRPQEAVVQRQLKEEGGREEGGRGGKRIKMNKMEPTLEGVVKDHMTHSHWPIISHLCHCDIGFIRLHLSICWAGEQERVNPANRAFKGGSNSGRNYLSCLKVSECLVYAACTHPCARFCLLSQPSKPSGGSKEMRVTSTENQQ